MVIGLASPTNSVVEPHTPHKMRSPSPTFNEAGKVISVPNNSQDDNVHIIETLVDNPVDPC